MKKILLVVSMALVLTASSVFAATTDFTATGDVNVVDVNYTGYGLVTFTILSGSNSESFKWDTNTFTVTDPGDDFKVVCASTTVKTMKAIGPVNACVKNTTPGTTYLLLPTTAGTYTIEPSDLDVPNALTYNSECGAATCADGYHVWGTGSAAECQENSSGELYCQDPVTGAPIVCPDPADTPSVISGGGGGGGSSSTGSTDTTTEPETTVATTTDDTTGDMTGDSATEGDTTENDTTGSEDTGSLSNVSDIPGVPAKDSNGNISLDQLTYDARIINGGDLGRITSEMGTGRDTGLEGSFKPLVDKIVGDSNPDQGIYDRIWYFITYGTKSTKHLGAGERAGVVNSFQAAFGKLPSTEDDWEDIMKIANGRWPDQRSQEAEDRAAETFQKIYLRAPDMNNANDNAAVTVMSYGLRPYIRNLESEKVAIKTFEHIFKKAPTTAPDWDAVRAIAYSGATR